MSSQFEVGNKLDTLEDKKNRLDFDIGKKYIGDDSQGELSPIYRAFSDISTELDSKGNGEKYDSNDIGIAISKRFDASVKQKTQNLNDAEKTELIKIKQEILSGLQGKNPKQMLEEYGNLRDKLYGRIASSDGKSWQKDSKLQQSQQEQKTEEIAKGDAFERLQDLLNKSETRRIEKEKALQVKKSLIQQEERPKEQVSAAGALDIALSTFA